MEQKKNIVILGAGFGGLRAAFLLARDIDLNNLEESCDIYLVDRNAYHTYTPTLYEAATMSKENASYLDIKEIVTASIPEVVKNTPIKFVQSEVESLDLKGGDIHLAGGQRIRFDYLVLALGSEMNYFGIPGLKENSLALKTFMDSVKIRDRMVALAETKKHGIRVVIGGGGSTGVELAGEIQGWMHELAQEKQGCDAKVSIVEAAPSLLLGFPNKVIEKIQTRLKSFGTDVLVNEMIAKVEPGKVILKSGRSLPYDLLVWTGGVKASGTIGALPLKIEAKGRVEVVGEMECLPQSPDLKLYGKIYAIGDIVCFTDPKTGRPIAGVARAAIAQADIAAHNIMADLMDKPHKKYEPKSYPYVIPVGGKWAIAQFGPVLIWGFFGWILKGLVEINYLLSIMPFWRAIKTWLKGLSVFIKNDRLG